MDERIKGDRADLEATQDDLEGRPIRLSDGDYVLAEGAAWIEVGPALLRIKHTGEGLSISVSRAADAVGDDGFDAEVIAECWVTNGELAPPVE